jgi:hypothetical protein
MEGSAGALVNPLFYESSLLGCFVVSDGGQILKQVAISMGTGTRSIFMNLILDMIFLLT